ncbi:hypothetical protein D3C85_1888970 [compost metagenome]
MTDQRKIQRPKIQQALRLTTGEQLLAAVCQRQDVDGLLIELSAFRRDIEPVFIAKKQLAAK